jgi:hypothetical protein
VVLLPDPVKKGRMAAPTVLSGVVKAVSRHGFVLRGVRRKFVSMKAAIKPAAGVRRKRRLQSVVKKS